MNEKESVSHWLAVAMSKLNLSCPICKSSNIYCQQYREDNQWPSGTTGINYLCGCGVKTEVTIPYLPINNKEIEADSEGLV